MTPGQSLRKRRSQWRKNGAAGRPAHRSEVGDFSTEVAGRLGVPVGPGIHAGGGLLVFTVKQTAERLGVSASLVYGLCSAGRLRHERYGLGRGTIRVPPDALDEYRRAQTVPVASRVTPTTPAPKPVQFKHLTIP